MKKFIAITLILIMFIITGENECEQYNSRETCFSVHSDGINCYYLNSWEGEGDDAIEVFKCIPIIEKDDCLYDPNRHNCFIKSGKEEPALKVCQMLFDEGEVSCGLGLASCQDYTSSRDKCLQLENCGYDEKRDEWRRCFMIYPEHHDDGCDFKDNKCTSNSNQKFCYLVDERGYTFCRSKDIQCSDFDQDSSNCLKTDLQDSTKKCSYDSSRSSGNKCFEVSIKDGCSYNNEDKTCQGEEDVSNGKICDMDYSENPVTCQKRNIQCNDLNGDESNCPRVKLPDKSKECSYNTENQKCVEKAKEATCNFNDQEPKSCSSSLPSKIICELNGDKNGCVSKNVECSDFENDQNGCNDAIISDSNKKCEYDGSKAENKCYAVSKECSDFYNEQECNSHKPEDELAKCVWSNECKEKTCETTSTENCGSFTPNDSGKQCSLSGDKTKCEEIPRSEDTKNGAENLKLFLSMLFLLFIF